MTPLPEAGSLVLEALCGSADDAAAAAACGATQAELCASLGAGGLSPSPGMVALAAPHLPVMAMLRPRPAGFHYSEAEFATILADAPLLAGAGATGLVFGLLTAEGRVDEGRCATLMGAVPGVQWVFHRAFDLVPEPFEALEALIRLGVRRVLTKGQANSFEEGEALLLALRERAAGRIEILVPGVRPHNVAHIVGEDGFRRLHFGRSREALDTSNQARPEVYFGLATRGREGVYEAFDADYFIEIRDGARRAAGLV